MWELVIIWNDGQKETTTYKTEHDAENAAKGYKTAFGNQIQWAGVRRARV